MWFSNEMFIFIRFILHFHYGLFLIFLLANIFNLVHLRLTLNLTKVLCENL